jgi:predicted nucleic acid-binding protein
MRVLDASSMIYAWDNYPMQQFPGLWEWMADQIEQGELTMPSVALEEVTYKAPECAEWLKACDLEVLEINNTILKDAMHIKNLLGIVGDKYHPKGVDENDLLIIATSANHNADLVSDESKQKLPDLPAKRKIPAVCAMDEVGITCISFIEYIKLSGAVFR